MVCSPTFGLIFHGKCIDPMGVARRLRAVSLLFFLGFLHVCGGDNTSIPILGPGSCFSLEW